VIPESCGVHYLKVNKTKTRGKLAMSSNSVSKFLRSDGLRTNALLALLAVAALGLSPVAYAAGTIKVGLSGPFTGGSSSMGVSMRDGVKLATAEINAAGGVLGKQIVLVERDDEAKNELGVQIARN